MSPRKAGERRSSRRSDGGGLQLLQTAIRTMTKEFNKKKHKDYQKAYRERKKSESAEYLDKERKRKRLERAMWSPAQRLIHQEKNDFYTDEGAMAGDLEYYKSLSPCMSETIETTFKSETFQIRKLGEFMGIWQLHACASILGSPVFSVYPDRGDIGYQAMHEQASPA